MRFISLAANFTLSIFKMYSRGATANEDFSGECYAVNYSEAFLFDLVRYMGHYYYTDEFLIRMPSPSNWKFHATHPVQHHLLSDIVVVFWPLSSWILIAMLMALLSTWHYLRPHIHFRAHNAPSARMNLIDVIDLYCLIQQLAVDGGIHFIWIPPWWTSTVRCGDHHQLQDTLALLQPCHPTCNVRTTSLLLLFYAIARSETA
jgi:hypothetical protein